MERGHEKRLGATFDEAAQLYDRVRPRYPTSLVDDLVELAELGRTSRVLEIGPGTGQLTVPLAERGCPIVAIEIGDHLAAVARRNLARFPSVKVATSAFEDWGQPAVAFDAIVAATAFHWIAPQVRVRKAAQALREGGSLAIVSTHHVAGGTESFFEESQACYELWDPTTTPGIRLPRPESVPTGIEEIEGTGLFREGRIRRYERELEYTTTAYLDLLQTYSGHRALPASALQRLLQCIAGLIDDRHSGTILKRYLWQLLVIRRTSSAA
jgi:protein-L-isoaspartate O-methyltransferase